MAANWRDISGEASGKPAKPASRRRKIVSVLTALLSVIAITSVLVYVLWNPSYPPHFLAIFLTQNADFPANAQAYQDWQVLNARFKDWTNAGNIQDREEIQRQLDALRNRSKNDRVVVYLSALVVPDESGELRLVAGDTKPDELTGSLKLQEFLTHLHECQAERKLLILDTMRPIADPRLGVLANDIAGRVHKLVQTSLDQHPQDKLGVLCACSPGQVALSAENLGHSVFGYYMNLGLTGKADGYGGGKAEGSISVRELAAYLGIWVDDWAVDNRGARQTPVLLGKGDDFELVRLPSTKAPSEPVAELETAKLAGTTTGKYPAWLQEGWQLRDRWENDGTSRLVPTALRQLETVLLKAEQDWRGGVLEVEKDYRKQESDLRRQQEKVLQALSPPEPRSLALAETLHARFKPNEEFRDFIRDKLKTPPREEEASSPAKDKPAIARGLNVDTLSKQLEEKYKMPTPEFAFNLACAAFQIAWREPNLESNGIELLAALQATRGLQNRYVESLFLERAAKLMKAAKNADRPANLGALLPVVKQAFRVVRDGELAAACASSKQPQSEPRVLPWIRPLLTAAAQKRHDGEVLLFAPGFAPLADAEKLLREAEDAYRDVDGKIASLQNAYHTYDRALLRLPGVLSYYLNRPTESLPPESWKNAIQKAGELFDLLSQAPPEDRPLSETALTDQLNKIKQVTSSLAFQLHDLEKPFLRDKGGDLGGLLQRLDDPKANPDLYGEADALLEAPCLRAADRTALWKAGQKFAWRVQATFDEDGPRSRQSRPWSDRDRDRALERESARAGRCADLVIDLFKLAGEAGSAKLDAFRKTSNEAGKDDVALPRLAHTLRKAWSRLTAQDGSARSSDADLFRKDRLGRVFPPANVALDAGKEASLVLEKRQSQLWKWLADRCIYEERDLAGLKDEARGFFVEASGVYQKKLRPQADLDSVSTGPHGTFDLNATTPRLQVRQASPEAFYPFQLHVSGATEQTPEIIPICDPDWLDIGKDRVVQRQGEGDWEVQLRIRWKPGTQNRHSPPPLGFLVRAEVNGRSFHHKVEMDVEDEQKRWKILLSDQKENPTHFIAGPIEIRPNTKRPVYLYVRNPGKDPKKVKVVLEPAGQKRLEAEIDAPPGRPARVVFESAQKLGPEAKATEPTAADLPRLERGMVVIRLLDTTNPNMDLTTPQEVAVQVASPSDYVEARPHFQPGEKNELTVQVDLTRDIPGDPCRVEMVLRKEHVPGYLSDKGGTLAGFVQPNQPLALVARDLQFSPDEINEQGTLFLTVDGWERALIYRVFFPRQGAPQVASRIHGLDLRLPPELLTRPDIFRLRLPLENAPPDTRIEVERDRSKLSPLLGNRDKRFHFSAHGAEGALSFGSVVRDWEVPLDLKNVHGPVPIRVSVLRGSSAEPLVKTTTIKVDATGPAGVHFVRVGKKSVSSEKEVKVPRPASGILTVEAEGEDPESGIKEVVFYWGKPAAKAMSEVEAKPIGQNRWQTDIETLKEGKRLDLTVRFTNGVGLPETSTILVELQESGKDTDDLKPGSITGTVEGQGGLRGGVDVQLLNKNDKAPLDTVQTDSNGVFAFKNVKPGTYKLFAKEGSRWDRRDVTVNPGKTVEVKLQMRLR